VALLIEGVYFGANRADFAGGALHTETGSSVTAQDTQFLGNSAPSGGAIAANGALTLTDVLIQNNIATGEGGGIQAYFNQTTLLRTTLEGNRARHGGGLLQRGGELELNDSEFVSNLATQFADGDGGGLHLYGNAEVSGTNVRLAQNRATDLGGGIYLGGEDTGGLTTRNLGTSAVLLGSRIEQNTARHGGGAYVYGLPASSGGRFSFLYVEDTQVRNNTAFLGGGIYSRGRFSAYRALIQDNGASDLAAGLGIGGGLFLESNFNAASPFTPDQDTLLEDTLIRGNQAGQGGGLYANDHALYLRASSFVQNVAENGGGAWIQGLQPLLPLARAAFVRNRGSRGAGLALSLYEPMSLQFLTFSDNRLEQTSGVKGRDLWLQANGASPLDVNLLHVTALNPALRPGATLHAEAGATFVYRNSVIVAGSAFDGVPSCEGPGGFRGEGGNVVGVGCPFSPPEDVTPDSIASLGLGPLLEVGPESYYVPATSSPLVDFAPCSSAPGPDQRRKPLNQDGNGDGQERCDSGAVERQSLEIDPYIVFRDGFED
jgi:predicted outer membrane repeat protein